MVSLQESSAIAWYWWQGRAWLTYPKECVAEFMNQSLCAQAAREDMRSGGCICVCPAIPRHAMSGPMSNRIHEGGRVMSHYSIRAPTSSPPTTADSAGVAYTVSISPFGPAERTHNARGSVDASSAFTRLQDADVHQIPVPQGSDRSGRET